MAELNGPTTEVVDSEELADEREPPAEVAVRCPKHPETHTQIEFREGYFYCEECENRNEHPRYQFIYDHSRDLLISHHDYVNQWGHRPIGSKEVR